MKVGGLASGLAQIESHVGSTFQHVLSSLKNETAAAKPHGPPHPSSPKFGMSAATAVLVLNKDFSVFTDGDNCVSRGDLQAVADSQVENASQEDRDAANCILGIDRMFDDLDTAAAGGPTDGLISRNDAERFAREKSVQVLNQDFFLFTGADNYVSRDDLQAVADGKVADASQEDREAAKYILSGNNNTFAVMDGYNARNHKEDGLISKNDANKFFSDGTPSSVIPSPSTGDRLCQMASDTSNIPLAGKYLDIISYIATIGNGTCQLTEPPGPPPEA